MAFAEMDSGCLLLQKCHPISRCDQRCQVSLGFTQTKKRQFRKVGDRRLSLGLDRFLRQKELAFRSGFAPSLAATLSLLAFPSELLARRDGGKEYLGNLACGIARPLSARERVQYSIGTCKKRDSRTLYRQRDRSEREEMRSAAPLLCSAPLYCTLLCPHPALLCSALLCSALLCSARLYFILLRSALALSLLLCPLSTLPPGDQGLAMSQATSFLLYFYSILPEPLLSLSRSLGATRFHPALLPLYSALFCSYPAPILL